MLLDAHADCARPSRFFLPLIMNAIAHRFAPLFEVGDLSTEKGDTDIGGLNFRDQPASHLFAGLLFWANYRCCAFLHNFGNAPFQERSPQWDHSPTCVSGWFLVEMPRSEVEICLLLSCFHGLRREPQQQCVIVRTLRAQADSFNACNQLWNADRPENLSTDVTFYRNNSS